MKNKILILICALIFFIGIIGSAIVLFNPKKTNVNIKRDGRLLYSFDLSNTEDSEIEIPYGNSSNTVEIKDGKIRVKEAECPDKTCVNMGWLSSASMPIVCLPNHLVIEFADGYEDGVDAVAR
jgi:hypothetical protein